MNLLITGAWNDAEKHFELLRKKHTVYFMQDEKSDLPCAADIVDCVVCNGLFLYHDVSEFKKLKVIQVTSAGLDRLPLDYINTHGIKVFNARGVYSVPMAEYAVLGVLELYKNSNFFYENQKKKTWEKKRDLLELFGKTVCIVGCGSVGKECAKRFSAFGCNIVGVDLFEINDNVFNQTFSILEIKKALSISDVVILTLPLTKETEGMFDGEMFDNMKDGSVIVNISRGKLIREDSLINALDSKLFGAVLDVFNEEPLNENSSLWQKKNVIITPHNSFVSNGNNERLDNAILGNFND